MEKILAIIFLFFSANYFSQDLSCEIIKNLPDKKLKADESIITFNFSGVDWSEMEMMAVIIDGVDKRVKTRNQSYTMKITPGYHNMKFFYWAQYSSPEVDSVLIKPAHRITMNVHFRGPGSYPPVIGK